MVDSIGELAELGVTYLTVNLPGDTRPAFLDHVAAFGEAVLGPVAGL